MAANNKITDLILKRKDGRTAADVLPDDIAVNFRPQYCNDAGAIANASDATHIRLTLNATPSAGQIAVLKNLTDDDMVRGLAQHIGAAKAALNKNIDDSDLPAPFGLRGLNADGSFSGGKKSKSKKQLKSKKQKKRKSVRRR